MAGSEVIPVRTMRRPNVKEQGRVTSRDGTTIAFERIGHGPALVLVDAAGGFSGHRPMPGLADRLASRYSVVTYDRRGRGESTDTLPYAPNREVEDLEALVEAVGGSAFVYGFSSGGLLGLLGAARGLAIRRLAAMEPPLNEGGDPDPDLPREVAKLVDAGRRGEAVEYFHRSIGVPAEITASMRGTPAWPALESVAHTLAYDWTVGSAFRAEILPGIATPTLVVASQATDQRLQGWARSVAAALPNGMLSILDGEWHGVSEDALAGALTEHFVAS